MNRYLLQQTLMGLLLCGGLAAQSPAWVRLDLIFIRIDIGGDNAGVGLQWPAVGVNINGVVGVRVGVPDPVPPTPAQTFAYLEDLLSSATANLSALLANNGTPAEIQCQSALIEAIVAQKSELLAMMV